MESNENPHSTPRPEPAKTFQDDFSRGYVGGLENINKASYESYLASFISLSDCERKIEARQQELRSLEQESQRAQTEARQVFDQLQEHTQQHARKSGQAERLQQRLSGLTQEEATLRERRRQTSSQYSVLAGLLYLVAGVVFMFGDLIISHEIVAYALNIRNNFEAWSFAVGLAALSVLFKPAYERLFEHPYIKEPSAGTRRRYIWFKGILILFAITTLFVLGWFRYEAYRADKLKDNINKTVRSLQMETSPETLQKIEQQLQNITALNLDLVNSPWAMASFILTGILFAVAGAVCLGIAFPVLQGYWHRWLQLDRRLVRLKREHAQLVQELEALEGEVSGHQAQVNIGERILRALPDIAVLEEKQLLIRKDLEKLYDDRKFAETDCRIAAFNDGYERGLVREKIGQYYYDAAHEAGQDVDTNASPSAYPDADSGTRRQGERTRHATRPYLAIRKMITSQFENDQLS